MQEKQNWGREILGCRSGTERQKHQNEVELTRLMRWCKLWMKEEEEEKQEEEEEDEAPKEREEHDEWWERHELQPNTY